MVVGDEADGAPPALCSVEVDPRVGGDGHEAGEILGVVGDVVQEHREAEPVGESPRRDRCLTRITGLGHPPRRRRRAGRHLRERVRQRRQEPPALRQCHRVRVHPCQRVDVGPRHAHEHVRNRQYRLIDDRKRGVREDVIGLGYDAGQGVLDREHAAVDLASGYRSDNVRDRVAWQELGVRVEARRRLGRVGPLFTEVCDRLWHSFLHKKSPRIPEASESRRVLGSAQMPPCGVVKAKPRKPGRYIARHASRGRDG